MWRCGDVKIRTVFSSIAPSSIVVLFLFLFLFLPFYSPAQQLTGHVVDAYGKPVSYASVYIREIALGLVADDNGNFRTRIEKGDYTLEISSMGFEKKTIIVNIPEKGLDLKVEMKDKIFELQEVVVTNDGEDPAYRIMRNVIARTPYFYRQLKSYESDVYLKGSFKIEHLPKFLKLQVNKQELSMIVGKLYILESQNTVKYTQPNKYEQHVVAVKSSLPADLNIDDDAPLAIVMNNIYAPGAFGGLLSPTSFSVYKFRLEDAYNENGYTIYKIKIIPKKKNRKLVNGYLNIVGDTWNIQCAYITENELSGITATYNLTYNEVKSGAFLPTSYDMSMNINLMGVKGYGKFFSSIQYKNVETNDFSEVRSWSQVSKQTGIAPSSNPSSAGGETARKKQSEKDVRKLQKDIDQLEALAEKERLTTSEARRMAKLITQTTETDEERAQKRKLEITPLDSFISVTKDTLALLRDSTFWEITRKVPLDTEELQSYIVNDSLKIKVDAIGRADSTSRKKAGTWFGAILWGNSRKAGKKFEFDFAGIPKICPEYNFVDGFRLGQKLTLTYHRNAHSRFTFTPSAYYTTARKTAVWNVNSSLAYSPLRDGILSFQLGNESADYAGTNGANRLINSVASLVFAENVVKFYRRKYIFASNHIDIDNGLRLNTELYYAKRNELCNHTAYNFYRRTPDSNLPYGYEEPTPPDVSEYAVMPSHNTFSAYISLQYTPRYHYYIRKGRKYYSHSAYPTFLLGYKKAFPASNALSPAFDRLDLTIHQQVKTDIFSNIQYTVNTGIYLHQETTYLPDYQHFNVNELFVTNKSLYNGFVLMNNYKYVTNEKWFQAHLGYTSDYLLIKRIPFLQNYLFTEDFHLKTLFLPEINHSEIGYSVGLGSFGRVGVFVGFDDWKYENTGIIISLPLMNIF
jgi:hypothetical protein